MIRLLSLTFVTSMFTNFSCAQKPDLTINTPLKINYKTKLVVGDLDIPWGMAFLPDSSILISEISGQLILFKNGNKKVIENVPPIYRRGQGGLMDIELHPNYKNNGWIYFTYSSSNGDGSGGNTSLMRSKLQDGSLIETQILYQATPNSTRGQHFGSRITFDHEGYLYFTIGDRGNPNENPQDITKDGGKVYRLKDDGSIPEDNPFINITDRKSVV